MGRLVPFQITILDFFSNAKFARVRWLEGWFSGVVRVSHDTKFESKVMANLSEKSGFGPKSTVRDRSPFYLDFYNSSG